MRKCQRNVSGNTVCTDSGWCVLMLLPCKNLVTEFHLLSLQWKDNTEWENHLMSLVYFQICCSCTTSPMSLSRRQGHKSSEWALTFSRYKVSIHLWGIMKRQNTSLDGVCARVVLLLIPHAKSRLCYWNLDQISSRNCVVSQTKRAAIKSTCDSLWSTIMFTVCLCAPVCVCPGSSWRATCRWALSLRWSWRTQSQREPHPDSSTAQHRYSSVTCRVAFNIISQKSPARQQTMKTNVFTGYTSVTHLLSLSISAGFQEDLGSYIETVHSSTSNTINNSNSLQNLPSQTC